MLYPQKQSSYDEQIHTQLLVVRGIFRGVCTCAKRHAGHAGTFVIKRHWKCSLLQSTHFQAQMQYMRSIISVDVVIIAFESTVLFLFSLLYYIT